MDENVFQDLPSILQNRSVIPDLILSHKRYINKGPIYNVYWVISSWNIVGHVGVDSLCIQNNATLREVAYSAVSSSVINLRVFVAPPIKNTCILL